MAHVRFTSKRYIKTKEVYRKSGKRRWKLVESESPCEVDIRFVAQFLQSNLPERGMQTMNGDIIVVTTYNPNEPKKAVTKFTPTCNSSERGHFNHERTKLCDA
jgi:hypothetical protein